MSSNLQHIIATIKTFGALIGLMMIPCIVIAIPLLLSSLFGAYYDAKFDHIAHMASQDDVEALMGKPDLIGPCYDGNIWKKCVSEWTYRYYMTPFDEWWVFFDKDGYAISTYRAVSP